MLICTCLRGLARANKFLVVLCLFFIVNGVRADEHNHKVRKINAQPTSAAKCFQFGAAGTLGNYVYACDGESALVALVLFKG